MNYYNPYFNFYPGSISALPTTKTSGLLGGLFKGKIGWASIITNTQKVLNIINQGIPMIKQISPIAKNAKTMFKVMNEFKRIETPQEVPKRNNSTISEVNQTTNEINIIEKTPSSNGPQFFI